MTTSDHHRRQPAGTPTGGQFAAVARAETGLGLTPGVGRVPEPRIGERRPDPRQAAAAAARTAHARAAGTREPVDPVTPLARTRTAAAAETPAPTRDGRWRLFGRR